MNVIKDYFLVNENCKKKKKKKKKRDKKLGVGEMFWKYEIYLLWVGCKIIEI